MQIYLVVVFTYERLYVDAVCKFTKVAAAPVVDMDMDHTVPAICRLIESI